MSKTYFKNTINKFYLILIERERKLVQKLTKKSLILKKKLPMTSTLFGK